MTRTTTTVVIGAGHAGLAMSHRLSALSIDHVLLERGEVANTWKTERWDSLRLLTPNWQSRLPGFGYDGDDPDGFMTMPEVISFIERYSVVVDGAGADRHGGHPATADVERLPRHHQRRLLERASRRGGDRCLQRRPPARASPPTSRRASTPSRPRPTGTRTNSPTVACWSSAHRRPASNSPTRSTDRAGR